MKNDENGEKLLYNPIKKDELQAVLSGQACPVATKGMFTFDESAYEKDANFVPGNVVGISANAGKLTGYNRERLVDLDAALVGHILATGNRTSQNGQSDVFAGTGTAYYALIQLDSSSSLDVA